MNTSFSRALDALQARGVGLVRFAPAQVGPDPQLCDVPGSGGEAGLLLLLSTGAAMTERALRERRDPHDPLDALSRAVALSFVEAALPAGTRVVYPAVEPPRSLDLRAWLRAARAQYVSPLGTGVRPDCGPWLAVRAAIVTRLGRDERELLERRFPPLALDASPCVSCAERPCVSACPAGAVSEVGHFALNACIEQRLAPASGCADRCAARLACPVGAEHRYGDEALRYHYGVSLRTLQRWRDSEGLASS